jgi:UDP-N-acetylglucosamine diphosphorylase/glucosamine-1-phosphate N-acetyltransferase
MTDLYLVEPEAHGAWYPFADCRPVAELRAGAWLIRERWEAIAGGDTTAIFGPEHLAGFAEDGVPTVTGLAGVDGPALVGESRFAPSGVVPELPDVPARLVNEGFTVGWWVPEGTRWEPGAEFETAVEVEGLVLAGAFDLLTALEHFLVADVADFTTDPGDPLPEGSIVVGDPGDVVILGAAVEPGVVFDVRHGAVVLEQHAYVRSGARLEGPVYVGPGSEILGSPISGCAIGPRCKVRGEVSSTSFLGYANKGHDGFVGHSVVGRWVNVGAGTTTSNLKNTYGPVRLELGGERIETGRQFLGTLFGDHAKVAIGMQFNTGSLVGVGANVFGEDRPPKYVAPFAWGESDRCSLDGFLAMAERVLPRRKVTVTDEVRATLEGIYRHAASA